MRKWSSLSIWTMAKDGREEARKWKKGRNVRKEKEAGYFPIRAAKNGNGKSGSKLEGVSGIWYGWQVCRFAVYIHAGVIALKRGNFSTASRTLSNEEGICSSANKSRAAAAAAATAFVTVSAVFPGGKKRTPRRVSLRNEQHRPENAPVALPVIFAYQTRDRFIVPNVRQVVQPPIYHSCGIPCLGTIESNEQLGNARRYSEISLTRRDTEAR